MRGNHRLDQTMREKGFVSVQEASRRTGLSASTIYKAMRDGAVTGEEVGARRYVEIASFQRYAGAAADQLEVEAEAGA